MRFLSIRQLFRRLAPRVCDACEGGSGYRREPVTGALVVCQVCGGTGDEQERTA